MAAVAHRKRWEERNLAVAGLLAWLIPGAGHFYQGRVFKGAIYCCCILGTFFGGQALGEWQVVHNSPQRGSKMPVSIGFAAQLGVGLPSLVSLVQAKRTPNPNDRATHQLDQPIDTSFEGTLETEGAKGVQERRELRGRIKLTTTESGGLYDTSGTFEGTADGQPISLKLGGEFLIGPAVAAGFQRLVLIRVDRQGDDPIHLSQYVRGVIPRSIVNGYGALPEPRMLDATTRRLGRTFELAQVCTWIAGLLNLLAIWDCVQGPAYGFGDELPVSTVTADVPAQAVPEASAVQPLATAPAGAEEPSRPPIR